MICSLPIFPRRLSKIEKNLDSVFSMLQHGNGQKLCEPQASPVSHSPGSASQAATSLGQRDFLQPYTDPSFVTPEATSQEQFSLLNGPQSIGQEEVPDEADVIRRGLITEVDADRALQTFKDEYSQYPFTITTSLSLSSLQRDHPFLLLAILVTTTFQQPHFHRVLEPEVRKVLATRVLLEGVRNLDLLQGLALYSTW